MVALTPSPAETFLQEAADLLEDLEAALLDLEHDPLNAELVNRAFRALHTIKGSGAMFGFDEVAEFTHHVEGAFQKVRDGEQSLSSELIAATLEAEDHIRDLLAQRNDVERGARLTQTFIALVAGGMIAAASAPPERGGTEPESVSSAPEDDLHRWHIRCRLAPQTMVFGTNPLSLLDDLRALGDCIVVALPDAIPTLDHMDPLCCYMEWDIFLATSHPKTAIEDVFLFVMDDSAITITPLDDKNVSPLLGEILITRGDVPEAVIEDVVAQQRPLGQMLVKAGAVSPERVVSALVQQHEIRKKVPASPASAPLDSGNGSVRVQAERLDSLMDQVGELVIAQARLRQLAAGSDDILLRAISEDIERLAADLRDTTMGIRMVPIGTLFSRFRRVVRDLSQSLHKEVALTTEGDEAELDKTVIERLNDPLVHLIRNCVDHGLEPADERLAAGKPAEGRVHLAAVHSGGQILITITDDGRGMNRASIRAKAEERGLTTPDAVLSDSEILNFIFHPGFSTAKEISAVSGRGVGLDVVKRTIDALRGTIDIQSTVGEGATITLRLPLTLAIIDGLLVRVGCGRYVIPLSAIEECVELSAARASADSGCAFLNLRGALVPFLHLRDIFHADGDKDPYQKVVVIAFGNERIGLVVDQVIGQHQTVIKSLSKLLSDVREFSGATILGDGSVALIVDVPRLVALGQKGRDGALAVQETA